MKLFVESDFKQSVVEGETIKDIMEQIQDEFNDCLMDLKFYNLKPMKINVNFTETEG